MLGYMQGKPKGINERLIPYQIFKENRHEKTIALLLTLVMLSCIVAGCSGNQNNNAPQDNDPANTAAPAQTDEPQVVYEKTYKSTFPPP